MRFQHAIRLAVVALFAIPVTQLRADITYNIVNYQTSQEGDTLSGSITTDGTIGVLTTANIVSANYTLVTPAMTYVVPMAEPFTVEGQLTASSTALAMPYSGASDGSIFSIFQLVGKVAGEVPSQSLELSWNDGFGSLLGDAYFAQLQTDDGNTTLFYNGTDGSPAVVGTPGSTIGNDPMLIATATDTSPSSVPEPATICSLGLALLMFAGGGALRLRRAA